MIGPQKNGAKSFQQTADTAFVIAAMPENYWSLNSQDARGRNVHDAISAVVIFCSQGCFSVVLDEDGGSIERRKRLVESSKAWLWNGAFCRDSSRVRGGILRLIWQMDAKRHTEKRRLGWLGQLRAFHSRLVIVRVHLSRTGCGGREGLLLHV